MVAFARFVMRDNGLAIHINTQQVTQVRQTTEGEPAIYIVGRESPMVVEGTLEAAIHKLEGAAAGLRIVESIREPVVEALAPVVAPPTPELATAEAAAVPAPTVEPDLAETAPVRAKPAKSKAMIKPATKAKATKTEAKPAKTDSKPAKPEVKPAKPAKPGDLPYPTASWFMGNR